MLCMYNNFIFKRVFIYFFQSALLSKQAQSKASEKEERAIKLLTQFRQKFAQVNSMYISF